MTDRVILAVKYTPVSAPAAVRKAVGGFLRYVQYRDKHADQPADARVSGLLKYVAYRDRATPSGRLFGPGGPAGDAERRDLATFVGRSVGSTRPRPARDGEALGDRRRAVYRFVLSPEHAEGLDLRRLTTAAMSRLEREAGVTGLRWIAAEHRNTAHPHTHIVLAAMREVGPGNYRGFAINKRRLAAMKEELVLEIARQRLGGREETAIESPSALGAIRARSAPAIEPKRRSLLDSVHRPLPRRAPIHRSVFSRLQLAAFRYRRQVERELERAQVQRDRELAR
jgi:hypothetical protein